MRGAVSSNCFSGFLSIIVKSLTIIVSILLFTPSSNAQIGRPGNPHYNKAGFFDMHVCNWPNQPLFFLGLFSTTQFNDINKIEIFDNNRHLLGHLDLDKYRIVMLKKPAREKRVFIKHFAIPKSSGNGWYSSKVYLKDGHTVTAKDYVIIYNMHRANGLNPADKTTLNDIPKVFRWNPVPGAKYYQVFINDLWTGKSLYSSDFLTQPSFTTPKNLLKHQGAYCWRVHARNINEDVLMGDFNHGSLTRCYEFDIN